MYLTIITVAYTYVNVPAMYVCMCAWMNMYIPGFWWSASLIKI